MLKACIVLAFSGVAEISSGSGLNSCVFKKLGKRVEKILVRKTLSEFSQIVYCIGKTQI